MAIDAERVVFDAEPLVAHATDEPGAETVARYLRAIQANECEGYCSVVNVTELHYILSRESDPERADEYVAWLETSGVTFLDAGDCWRRAADFVYTYNPALGDSYALATASTLECSLVIGGDAEYDEVTDVELIRFREGGV